MPMNRMATCSETMFDVAVVGAGPAGAATARRLALCGLQVLLLERSRMDTPRIGESLAPAVQPALRSLGVWDRFMALGALPSWGTRSIWGEAQAQSHSHLQTPWGCGWHVDRAAFDRMLAQAAAAAGAQLREGIGLHSAQFDGTAWVLNTTDLASPCLHARVLVDATGRRAQLARAFGAQRLRFDNLVGVAVRWSGIDPSEQGHLLVETVAEGWWYTAPLPAGGMVAMLMTDADLCARDHLNRAPAWHSALTAAPESLRRLATASCESAPQVHTAHSQRLHHDPARAPGPWLAVGDAALAVDPVSGSGVLRALDTAEAAAEAVQQVLTAGQQWRVPLADYEAGRDAECSSFLIERAQYYEAEERFAAAPFWQRRSGKRRSADHLAARALSTAA
jgi:flavin-dependent dehydrogenase